MTIKEAGDKARAILNGPEVRSHEDYVMLLIRVGNWVAQQRQLLQDAVDGHCESKQVCEALGIEATLTKYGSSLEAQPRIWPGPVVARVEREKNKGSPLSKG